MCYSAGSINLSNIIMNILEDLFSLKNEVVIVFGGGGQIGFEASKAICQAGAKVYIADYDKEQTLEKIKKFNSDTYNICFQHVDVSNKNSVSNVYKEVNDAEGKITKIVNSFHYKGDSKKLRLDSDFFTDLENYDLETWNRVHDINLTGTFITCQQSIPYFKKNNSGAILNISSTYGNISPNKNIYKNTKMSSPVAYASSKAGIINLSRYFATYLAEFNIRVNVLSPGGVQNDQDKGFIKEYSKLTPLRRMALPSDYLASIIFMLSNGSSYLTGSNVIVDGGWTAW